MFKYVLSLTFAVGFASAAIINTTATCDGVTTVGTFGASCNDGRMEAGAGIDAPLFASDAQHFGVVVHAGESGFPPGMSGASANFSGDYVFTVTGGIGNGFFFPIFFLYHNGATAGMSFAGISGDPCFPPPNIVSCSKPFTFGVPQIVAVGMGGEASAFSSRAADASASLNQILFLDPAGNILSNATFTLVEVPEPRTWCLVGVGLMIFLAVPILGTRLRDALKTGDHCA
jgi:hypothetical protein